MRGGGTMANGSNSSLQPHHAQQQQQQQQGIGRPPHPRDLSPEPRMGRSGCCTGFLCLGSLKRGKRIVPANRIHDGSNASPRPWGNNGGAPQPGGASNLYATLSPSLLAPPSSPASFQNSAVQSSAQSPCAFPVMSNPAATTQIPLESAQTMFQMGPYAHETALVSPPVFSTFTTAPSTAPFTPPPELATHVTTPSSPDVPFAQYLANSFGTKATPRSQHPPPPFPTSSFTSPDVFSADDLQAAYQLYPGSPLAHLISPTSGTGASTPFPDSEMSTQLTLFPELENSQTSPPPATVVVSSSSNIFISGSPMPAVCPSSRSMGSEVDLGRATPSQTSSGALTPAKGVASGAISPPFQTDLRSEVLAFSLQTHAYTQTLKLSSSKASNLEFANQEQQPCRPVEDPQQQQHSHHEISPAVAVAGRDFPSDLRQGQRSCGWKAVVGQPNVEHGEEPKLHVASVKTYSSNRSEDGRQQLRQQQANGASFFAMSSDNRVGNDASRDESNNNVEAKVVDHSPKIGPAVSVHVELSGFVLPDGRGRVNSTMQIEQQQGEKIGLEKLTRSFPSNFRQDSKNVAFHKDSILSSTPPSPRAFRSNAVDPGSSSSMENAVVLNRSLEPEALVNRDPDLAPPQQFKSNNNNNNASIATGTRNVSISDLVAWEHLKGTKLPPKLSMSKASLLETTSSSNTSCSGSGRAGTGSSVHSRSSSKDSTSAALPPFGGSSLPMIRLSDGGAACSDGNVVRIQQGTVAALNSATSTPFSAGHFDAAGAFPSAISSSSLQQFNFATQKFEATGHVCGEEHGKDCAGGRAKLENKCVLKVLLEHAMEKPAGAVVKDRVGIYREQQLNASFKWMQQAGTALHHRSMVDSSARERADLGTTCGGSHSGSSTPPLGITLVEETK